MSPRPTSAARRLQAAILVVDAVVLLAPPLHWKFGNGEVLPAVGYFLGANALVALSLVVLYALASKEPDVASTQGRSEPGAAS